MMYNYGYEGFVPFGLFGLGGIFMILFWVAVIYGVVWLFRKESTSTTTSNKNGKALEILKERYVKGEVTKHQFEEMRKDIRD